jgi:hypothetical protein
MNTDPEPTYTFAELVADLRGAEATRARQALGGLFLDNVARVASRYPPVWFDGFRKDVDGYRRLSRLLQNTSEAIKCGWFPFEDRTPYLTWVAERSSDRTVVWFTFSNKKYGLLKQQLKEDYRENLLVHPSLRGRQQLWRRVTRLLDTYAERTGEYVANSPVWELRPERPTPSAALDVAFEKALAAAGVATQAALVEALHAHESALRLPEPPPVGVRDPDRVLLVRRVVLAVWNQLSPEEQAIMAEVGAGRTAREMYERRPYLANASGVTKAIATIDDRFLRAFQRERGAAFRTIADLGEKPRVLCEQLYVVIEEVLRSAGTWREAGRARGPGLPTLLPFGPGGWEAFERLWDALRDAGRARDVGLADSFVAGIAEVAWDADPAHALAEAAVDEGWIEDEE